MKVIHRFYLHPRSTQNKKIVSYAIYLLLSVAIVVFLAFSFKNLLPLIFLPFVISVMAPFIDVPLGRRKGSLVYYSPLLLASALRNNRIELHGGTLFDYYFTLSISNSERRNRRLVLYSYLAGLINLLNKWDENNDDLILKANAYFIRPATAARLGFRQVKINYLQKFLMAFNYLPIMLSYSIMQGKLSFPNIFHMKSYEASLGDLRAHEEKVIAMLERLKK